MQIAVVGAGVIGVTTAYELAADGHDVVVYERRDSVAAEASFANAGLVAPGYVSPWAAPGMLGKVVSHLGRAHAPVRVAGMPDLATLGWLWRWWRACRPPVYRANRARMHRLAQFSRERLNELATRLNLEFERADGFLVLLRTPRDLALAEAGIRALTELGAAPQLLDAAGCRSVEPGLSADTPLHAGGWSSDDEVGNCRQFTHLLRREAERLGARFRFESTVERVAGGTRPTLALSRTPRDRARGLDTRADTDWPITRSGADENGLPGTTAFDAVVVSGGVDSRQLLRPIGVRLPIVPVYGYSVTAPLRNDASHLHLEPRAAVMDERYKVAISRLGRRVRVAGGAEIGGRAGVHDDAAHQTLDKVLDDWFPGVTRRGEAMRWKGARPMLPDGPPVLGPSGVEGVWLSVGHGGSGWALSCGSARLLADAIAGRRTPIDVDGLGIGRLRT